MLPVQKWRLSSLCRAGEVSVRRELGLGADASLSNVMPQFYEAKEFRAVHVPEFIHCAVHRMQKKPSFFLFSAW